jgi:hypothetical protein
MKILDFFMVDQIVLAKGEKIGSSFHYNIINCLFKKIIITQRVNILLYGCFI